MKPFFPLVILALGLSACAGGFPPTSSNGLNAYDVIFGLKEVPENADDSRVWSPVHQVVGAKPTWSIVWFKEKTKDGKDYELTAKSPEEMPKPAAKATPEPKQEETALIETASLLLSGAVSDVKGWFDRILAPDPVN